MDPSDQDGHSVCHGVCPGCVSKLFANVISRQQKLPLESFKNIASTSKY